MNNKVELFNLGEGIILRFTNEGLYLEGVCECGYVHTDEMFISWEDIDKHRIK